jgi:hypothetical protein
MPGSISQVTSADLLSIDVSSARSGKTIGCSRRLSAHSSLAAAGSSRSALEFIWIFKPRLRQSGVDKKAVKEMLVSRNNELQDSRDHYSVGRIKASSRWHPVSVAVVEADRLAAVQALIREAQEYEADAIVGLDFEVDEVMRDDIDGMPLQRVAAKGIAIRFSQAA